MILAREAERDLVACLSSEGVRRELEGTVHSDSDNGAGGGLRRGCGGRRGGVGGGLRGTVHRDRLSDGDDASRTGGGGGSGVTDGVSLVLVELVARVDREDHSLLAMVRLAAVDPDRRCVRDGELRDREVARLLVGDRDTSTT